jgi:hypothetical protein
VGKKKSPISKKELKACIENAMSVNQLSKHFKRSSTTMRWWLKKYNLKTDVSSWYGKGNELLELECGNCGKGFKRKRKDYEYKKRNLGGQYCSLSCSPRQAPQPHAGFQIHWMSIKKRCKDKKYNFNLTKRFLVKLWEKQEGICAITGLEMLEPVGYVASRVPLKTPKTASIDRIDSNKGYTKGNVQWVCVFANLAKNTFEDKLIKETFNELKKLTKSKSV